MANPGSTIWELKPHTKAKHFLLRRYLQAWFPILGSRYSHLLYVDGFAGPGRYKGDEPGSPIIALDAASVHVKRLQCTIDFVFIEEIGKRFESLQLQLKRLTTPPNFKCYTEYGPFRDKIEPYLCTIETSPSPTPSFFFLDPDGFSGLPFSTIRRILELPHCETFITFLKDAMNRFLEHPEEEVRKHIVDHFGTETVLEVANAPGDRVPALRALYQGQLQGIAKYVRYFEMRDESHRPIYDLIFASNDRLGHLKMKEAMWKLAPQGDFSFSDATDPNQLVLFQSGLTAIPASMLVSRFSAHGCVPVAQVRAFTEDETPFLPKHMRAALKQLEQSSRIIVDPSKIDGKMRRAGTFPDNATIRFA